MDEFTSAHNIDISIINYGYNEVIDADGNTVSPQ
jgi:hypothetical protein